MLLRTQDKRRQIANQRDSKQNQNHQGLRQLIVRRHHLTDDNYTHRILSCIRSNDRILSAVAICNKCPNLSLVDQTNFSFGVNWSILPVFECMLRRKFTFEIDRHLHYWKSWMHTFLKCEMRLISSVDGIRFCIKLIYTFVAVCPSFDELSWFASSCSIFVADTTSLGRNRCWVWSRDTSAYIMMQQRYPFSCLLISAFTSSTKFLKLAMTLSCKTLPCHWRKFSRLGFPWISRKPVIHS